MKSKNTIELNGKRYDALTGTVLDDSTVARSNIDGVLRGQNSAPLHTAAQHHVTVRSVPEVRRPVTTSKPTRATATHVHPHQPENAVTLMRRAVKRPETQPRPRTVSSLQHKVPSLITTKQSAYSINEQRLARAHSTARSPHITRHATERTLHVPVTVAPLAVHPGPTKPEIAAEPTAPAPAQTNKPFDMFEHAIANAGHFVDTQSRKHHLKKQTRRHVISMAAGTLALFVIAGFALYQNTPGLQFKVASIQAGVSTRMPNLKAAGFAYNGVKAGDGMLTVGFKGNSGNYQLVQQTTNWSGSDMIQNVGATDASGNPDYTTVQIGKTTVYRLSTTNATWVANGKWYTVSGNHALSDTQVQSLVQNV